MNKNINRPGNVTRLSPGVIKALANKNLKGMFFKTN